MADLLAVLLVIILVIAFVIFIVLPSAAVLLAVSAVYGLYIAVRCAVIAAAQNREPYLYYADRHPDAPKGARRNYFFGPGFRQLERMIQDMFRELGAVQARLNFWFWTQRAEQPAPARMVFIVIWFVFATVSQNVLSTVWCCLLAALMSAVLLTGMGVFFLLFSTVWLADRVLLLIRAVQSRCPNDKRKCAVPVFLCPSCRQAHKKLTPGPYGVLHRRCACGQKLAATCFGGRSAYEARCPYCGTGLYAGNARQYGIQLVGGIGVGKTSFLAAFWHEYRAWLETQPKLSYEPVPEAAFQALEAHFARGTMHATDEINANMYSMMHVRKDTKRAPIQVTVYDVAGETFDYTESSVQQQQFGYCEGFVIVLDPQADTGTAAKNLGVFLNQLDALRGMRVSKMLSVPAAVVISKADLFQDAIGLAAVREMFEQSEQPADAAEDLTAFQDQVCRQFLAERGYANILNLLDAKFEHVCCFPVSAMGHALGGGAFEPWGILEPVFWLMRQAKRPIRELCEQDT